MENRKSVNEYEAAVLRYNKIAMNYLRFNNLKDSLMLLRKAEDLLNSDESLVIPNRLKLMGITLNNLGCYFKKRKQPKVALSYLEQALEIENQTEIEDINIASSHLNICAVYSSLSNHKRALVHAKQALTLLESNLQNDLYSFENSITLVTSLAISYYNVAVEHEHLGNLAESLKYYEKALEFSRNHLGLSNAMTTNIQETIKKFESKHRKVSKSAMKSVKVTMNQVDWKQRRLPSVTPRARQLDTTFQYNNRLSTAYEKGFDATIRY